MSGELVWSYLQRLGHANNVDPEFLNQWILHLGVPGGWSACLAVLTGKPERSLREAIIDLVAPFTYSGARGMVIDRDDHTQIWQCRECAASKEITEPVRCWVPFHRKACVRHRRWLHTAHDDNPPRPEEIIGLAAVPEAVAAQHQLTRLARRHPPDDLRRNYQEAYAVVIRWAARDDDGGANWWRLLDLLVGNDSRKRILITDPALPVGLFPATVRLTAIFANPHWHDAARQPADHPTYQALQEELFECAAPMGYRPDVPHDPLERWLRAQRSPGDHDGWLLPGHYPHWPNLPPAHLPDPDDVPDTIHIAGYRAEVLNAERPVGGMRLFHLTEVVTFHCSGTCGRLFYSDWIALPHPRPHPHSWRHTKYFCRRCYSRIINGVDSADSTENDDYLTSGFTGPRTS